MNSTLSTSSSFPLTNIEPDSRDTERFWGGKWERFLPAEHHFDLFYKSLMGVRIPRLLVRRQRERELS